MTTTRYEYLGSTSYQLIIWACGFSFGIHIIWSDGIFFMWHVFRQMSEEQYKEIRDADGN